MAARRLKPVRRRVERALASPAGQALPAALVAAHLRRAFGRTQWHVEGREALAEEAGARPVILALWHGRLMCAARFWDTGWGPLTTLTSQAYPGRLAGQALRRFGLETRAMHERRPNRAESLALARAMRAGMSIGVAVDGPLGPARQAKTVPLDWSRLTGAPIWLVGFSATRFWQMDSWDRLVVPRAGGAAWLLYRRFGTVDKRAGAEAIEAQRLALQTGLDALTEEADRRAGHPGLLC